MNHVTRAIRRISQRRLAAAAVAATTTLALSQLVGPATSAPAPSARPPSPTAGDAFDHSKVLGADSCAKCHRSEVDAWRGTPHHQTIDTLHRKLEAKEIARRLGLRSVKRNDTCVRCHYTRKLVRDRVRIDSGVSCESCHGPSRDWLEVHADYGAGVTRLTESADHRRERRRASIAAGMNNPSNLYLIARQCLDCHTTPDERLVDTGGHPAGSRGFDLVAWSQGTVRHNFVRSDGLANQASPIERLRVMHVVGLMTDLEYSLRATAEATSAGVFGVSAAERAALRKRSLWEVQRRLDHPLLRPALEAVARVELRLGEADAIRAAADAVGEAAFAFADREDGVRLAAIDDLLPSPTDYK